jgi:hypothetical protein
LKYLHKELPAFCYSWAWDARCVCAFEKEEFIEAIQELKVLYLFISLLDVKRDVKSMQKNPFKLGRNSSM